MRAFGNRNKQKENADYKTFAGLYIPKNPLYLRRTWKNNQNPLP